MKRAICCKMAVGYEITDVGSKMAVGYEITDVGSNRGGSGNVVYKVGSKGGFTEQQCSEEGAPKGSFKMNGTHLEKSPPASWNVLSLPVCVRNQSQDSIGCDSSVEGLEGKRSSSGSSMDSEASKSSGDIIYGSGDRSEEQYGARMIDSYGAHRRTANLFVGQPLGALPMDRSELSMSSSSIGEDDDRFSSSGDEDDEVSSPGDMEAGSCRRSGGLHQMNSLKDSLPIKRGLSRFWNGKAKSFACLADASSIEMLAKPERPFLKRRRITTIGERHKSFPPLSQKSNTGISKRAPFQLRQNIPGRIPCARNVFFSPDLA